MYTLRKYQEKAVEDCLWVMAKSNRRGVAVMPTGAGKSLVIAEVARKLDKPIIVLQPSKELLKQNYDKFTRMGGKATIYSASLNTKESSKITFATIGSIKNEVEQFKDLGVKHIIIDEVHLGTKRESQFKEFIDALGVKNILGLTATPVYLQNNAEGARLAMINRSQKSIFRKIIHVTQIEEMISGNFWTPLKYKIFETNQSGLKLNTSGSEYTDESQKDYYKSNDLNSKIEQTVDLLLNQKNRKRILVFVPSIEDAESLHGRIPNSMVVHSKLSAKKRDRNVKAFDSGEVPVAINVNVLATGYDNPEIDTVILARPTASIAILYQQIGRAVRLHPDKQESLIVDFSGNTSRFGKIEHLSFKEIDEYGWGMFGENGVLLSDLPILESVRPNVDTVASFMKERRKQQWG